MTENKAGKKTHSGISIAAPEKILSAKGKRLSKTAVPEAHRCNGTDLVAASKRNKITLLAYTYWLQRGCPDGSPDEDWFRAEREIDLGLLN
jgi:hypothetical protein